MNFEPPTTTSALLQLKHICLNYGQVKALDDISLEIGYSEVHAMVGEHGAGKSSIGRLISGLVKPDGGQILFSGRYYEYLTLKLAIKLGIGMVYQQIFLNQHFTVAENLFFPDKDGSNFFWHSKKRIRKEAENLLTRYDFDITPDTILRNLSLSDQTLVDILKNLHRNPSLLILDEALERLSSNSLKKIIKILLDMKEKGMSILFITHRIDDIYNLADKITILKNGQILITDYVKNINKINLIKMAYTQIIKEPAIDNLNKEFYHLLKYNEAILRNLPVNLIVVDSERRIKLVNNHCKDYFGLRNYSYINASLSKLFTPNNPKVLELILNAFNSKEGKSFYQVSIIVNYSETVNNIKIFPIYDGTLGIGHILIIEDISEYDRLQKQFVLSEKLASVGLLAAGVAHEINNPLEVIYNYLSYIKYKFPDPEIQDAIDNVNEEISSIAAIVSNLHSFSDNSCIETEEIEINELISAILTLVIPNARHKNIHLSFYPYPKDILISINKNELKQVILNILKNSLEALGVGGEIDVKTDIENQKEKGFAKITFSDTGPGIQARKPDDVFLPFFSTKKDTGTNIGLGLSTSHGIIKKYNGSIQVENNRHRGCKFTILIPLINLEFE